MAEEKKYDIVVIGAGPGGYCAAIRAAQLGFSTAVIEKRPTMGGTCLNIGCIPSKALLDSSEYFTYALHGLAGHGIKVGSVLLDCASMMARKERIVAQLTKGVESLLRQNHIAVLPGNAHFLNSSHIEIDSPSGKDVVFANRAVIIATGSLPAVLPSLPVDGVTVVDSTGALSFTEPPKSFAVIGGGAIGLELASVWARLGSNVTIIELAAQLLPGWDSQSAKLIQRLLTKQGMRVITGGTVIAVNLNDNKAILTVRNGNAEESVEADRVLVAVGRRPWTGGLNLGGVGIEPDPKTGRVTVDKNYMTSCDKVYAIGDLIAGPMLAHKASAEGVAAVERIAGKAGSINYEAIAGVVYTSPEVAAVGRCEDDLKARSIAYKSGIFQFKANGRAMAMDRTDGFVKVLADTVTDRVLGVQIVGPNAADLIAQAVTVIEFGGSAEDMARITQAHPSLSEVIKEAALDVEKMAIHAPPVARE